MQSWLTAISSRWPVREGLRMKSLLLWNNRSNEDEPAKSQVCPSAPRRAAGLFFYNRFLVGSLESGQSKMAKQHSPFRQIMRRRRDSNPRTRLRVYPISSRGRYDRFDTSPNLSITVEPPEFEGNEKSIAHLTVFCKPDIAAIFNGFA